MITEDYKEYLNSPQWAKIRNKVLQRDDFKCSICGSYRGLQVHHLNYNHFKDEGNHLNDLMTLCNKCHEKIENKKKGQDKNNNYLKFKEEQQKEQQKFYEEKNKKQRENYEIFMWDNEEKDISNLNGGEYDFCNLPFLKKYIIKNYGEEFYDNLRKTDISNYFGAKRNIIIAKMIIVGKKDYEIAKYGFTFKRIQSIRKIIEEFSQFDDIFEFMKILYNTKIYGCVIDKKILENFIFLEIIKDEKYDKFTLIENLDIIIDWWELLQTGLSEEFLVKPKLGDD